MFSSACLTYCLPVILLSVRCSIAQEITYDILTGDGDCPGTSGTKLNPQGCNELGSGGLCAYIAAIDKGWCCTPGKDEAYCYDWYETCQGATSTTPGPDQTLCSEYGATWCCGLYETCIDLSENKINLCASTFANPYQNVSLADAVAQESAASSSSTTFTSTSISGTTSSTSSSATTTSSTSAQTIIHSSSTAGTSSPSSSPTTPALASQKSMLSHGAIAGIAIGAVLGVVVVAVCAFLIARRLYKGKRDTDVMDMPVPAPVYYEPKYPGQPQGMTTGESNPQRYELQNNPLRAEFP